MDYQTEKEEKLVQSETADITEEIGELDDLEENAKNYPRAIDEENVVERKKTYLEKLAESYGVDRVRLLHKKGEESETIAVFWKGDKRYVGIAGTNPKDQYDRKMGRTVAISKALHALRCDTDPKYTKRAEKLRSRTWRSGANIMILDMKSTFTPGECINRGLPNFLFENNPKS